MKLRTRLGLVGVVAAGLAFPSIANAQDCAAMVGEIDQMLKTADISQKEKDKVMELRDEGAVHNSRASTDCTEPLMEALNILKGE